MTTSGEAVAQSTAASVPRPPQPMTPTRILSDAPAAKSPPGNAVASEASEAVLRTSRRVKPAVRSLLRLSWLFPLLLWVDGSSGDHAAAGRGRLRSSPWMIRSSPAARPLPVTRTTASAASSTRFLLTIR